MRRRGFTLLELLLVVGIVGLFAGLVIPGFANGSRPMGEPVADMLAADLRRARTESMVRGQPVVIVAAHDGSAWWLALASDPGTAIDGTTRAFGRGGLAPMKGAKLLVKGEGETDGARVFATFDALGSRDEAVPVLELRDARGERVEQWTLPAGRARLER